MARLLLPTPVTVYSHGVRYDQGNNNDFAAQIPWVSVDASQYVPQEAGAVWFQGTVRTGQDQMSLQVRPSAEYVGIPIVQGDAPGTSDIYETTNQFLMPFVGSHYFQWQLVGAAGVANWYWASLQVIGYE